MVTLTISGSAMLGSTCRSQDAEAADPRDPGGGDVVAAGDAGDERLAEPGEAAARRPDRWRARRPSRPTPKMTAKNRASSSPGNATTMLTERRRRAGRLGDRAGRRRAEEQAHDRSRCAVPRGPARPRAWSRPARGRTCRGRGCRCRASARRDGPARRLAVSTASAAVAPEDRREDSEQQHDRQQRSAPTNADGACGTPGPPAPSSCVPDRRARVEHARARRRRGC